MSTIFFTAHGLVEGQAIKFANVLPDDTGIDETVTYYVIADNLTADSFEFSETPGGASFVLANDIASGDVIMPEEYEPLDPEEEPTNVQQGWATVRDLEPPAIPSGLTLTAAVKGLFAKWSQTTANDLAFYELRYALDDGTGTGPDTSAWTHIRARTTGAYIGGLVADSNADGFADTRYWVQVRAVDNTGNVAPWAASDVTASAATNILTTPSAHLFAEGDLVRVSGLVGGTGLAVDTDYYVIADSLTSTTLKLSTSLGGSAVDITVDYTALTVYGYPVYRDFSQEAETGWCIAVSVDPVLVGDDTIEYQSIGTEHVKVTGLSADVIKTGTLDVNTTDDDMTDGIKVFDDGVLIGWWTEAGLYIYKATDTDDYIRLFDGGLSVFLDGVETAAITPEGVNASALIFGSLPGGHNVVLNSGFELAAFGTGATQAVWDVTSDFTGTEVSKSNVTVSNGLSATSLSY